MNYDFESIIDRTEYGSGKWYRMRKHNPNLPSGVIPLSVADMEVKNAPEIIDGLREFLDIDKLSLGYVDMTDSYREAVGSWMKTRHGWDVDMRWNVESPGVVTAFFNTVRAYTKPGDGVIIFSPVYYPFFSAAKLNGRAVIDIPLIINGSRYEIDWDRFEAAASVPSNKLLLFCSPHNPIGRVWLDDELRRVSDICLKHGVVVISDEIHNDLIMPGYKHTVFATLSDEAAQNCVVCTSPSKTFSLAGLQASNIFIPNDELRRKFADIMLGGGLSSLNIIGYKACEIAYTKCAAWLEQAIELIHDNAKYAEAFLAENIPQIKVYPLEGTYLQWWDCRSLFDDHLELERFMRDKAYMFLDEGYIFGETGKGFERINLACPKASLRDALDRLATAVNGSLSST